MAKPSRPGIPLCDAEVLAASLKDVVDTLEAYQTPATDPGIEDALATVRFVRRRLVEISETKF
jgi:hypothetical protein